MRRAVKMLWICVGETDVWETVPLYEAVVRRLRQLGVAGATVHTGTMGFGGHRTVHHKRLFHISDDKPVSIITLDSEEKIRQVLPEIRGMVKDGFIALLDAEIVESAEGGHPKANER